jgi:ribosomal protein S27AE
MVTSVATAIGCRLPSPDLSPHAEKWECSRCGRMLGLIDGAFVAIKVRPRSGGARSIVAALPCRQDCPDCGATNIRG